MSKLPAIIDLFANLASKVQTLNSPSGNVDESVDLLISNLNQSLNLRDRSSRVRVLDTALSLMCFTAPQVFDSVIDYSVKTIISVLRSSIHCKVLSLGKEEIFRVGGSISFHDCGEVIEACADILGKLKEYGLYNAERTPSSTLLYAVVRLVALATYFRHSLQLTPILEVKPTDSKYAVLSKLFCHIPERISLESQEIPLRLLSWHLDPYTLKDDVSKMLHEVTRRPFLCLSVELHERMEWRSIMIYLVLSPAMFVETRSLLHNWFLLTGLASVLELLVKLASLVLDILSRPMWWGISAELGSKLPFSHAYFPENHQMCGTFSEPLSCRGFLQLVHSINKSLSQTRKCSFPSRHHAATTCSMVDQKSVWAMAMNFLDWFYLASVLLFFEESFQDFSTPGIIRNEQLDGESPSYNAAAARYIAWILNPISKPDQDLLAECLNKLSGSLPIKQSSVDNHKKATCAYKKKLKKPKLHSNGDETFMKEYDCQAIQLWLKEFEDMYINYYNVSVKGFSLLELETSQRIGVQRNLLFRRVSLGILIGCPNSLSDDGCALVLHYAATGTVLPSTENQISGFKHRRWISEEQEDCIIPTENLSRKDAVAGSCIVFHLTDIVESMAGSLFESDGKGEDFICRVKLRAGKYLLKCVKRLLLDIDQDVHLTLKDLYNRLLRWRYQGKDVFKGYQDLDDAIDAVKSKLSSLRECK